MTNGGCATEAEHRVAPAAMAYSAMERPAGAPAPHPGEGTRMAPLPPESPEEGAGPIPFRSQRPQASAPRAAAPISEPPVIGGNAPATQPMIHRQLPSTAGVPPMPQRRYRPPVEESPNRRKLPEIYDGHRIIGYWYVPAAILVAIAVAFGVIWMASALFGGDDDPDPAANTTPAPTTAAGAGLTPAASASAPAGSAASPTPGGATGQFKAGDILVVTNTGDCLNVRVAAGRENDAIICVKDGTEVKVTDGPQSADALTWWKVQTVLGEGWAAEDYLVKKP